MPLPFSFHWLCSSLPSSSRCKELKYSKELPQISIIFIFVNEALSVILRSVHSAVNHTPTHLLKEIILVDDNSDEGMGAASLHAVFWDNASRQCTMSAGGCALISSHPEPKCLCLLSLGHSWGMGAVWGEVSQANTSSLLESSRAGVSQCTPPPPPVCTAGGELQASTWAKLHLYLQPLPIAHIPAWVPLPVRSAAPLDSHSSANPTVNCTGEGYRLHAPYENHLETIPISTE